VQNKVRHKQDGIKRSKKNSQKKCFDVKHGEDSVGRFSLFFLLFLKTPVSIKLQVLELVNFKSIYASLVLRYNLV
jgi:hypothetical protein